MTNQFRLDVGHRVRALREAAGYRNQREFAKLLGVSASELSRIEHGLRRLDTMLLRRIAEKLDVAMETFFPDEPSSVALARRGDADAEALRKMVGWAQELQLDLERIGDYVGGPSA
jgi:transcriptional regulator with XRE-family HTH domain